MYGVNYMCVCVCVCVCVIKNINALYSLVMGLWIFCLRVLSDFPQRERVSTE